VFAFTFLAAHVFAAALEGVAVPAEVCVAVLHMPRERTPGWTDRSEP
jgi:hypothetical protein